MDTKACYRKLNNYKYQLREPFQYQTDITGYDADHSYITLDQNGLLKIKENYAWDGASGPTWDTKNSMRASLVHDAFYQLLRLELVPQSEIVPADKLFRKMLVKDGMSKLRAWVWYRGLRLANGVAAKPGTQEDPKIICAP